VSTLGQLPGEESLDVLGDGRQLPDERVGIGQGQRRLDIAADQVAERVADVPGLGRGLRRQVSAVDDAAQVGLLGTQVVEQWSYVGGDDGPLPDVNRR
jgi:hypothetical protein